MQFLNDDDVFVDTKTQMKMQIGNSMLSLPASSVTEYIPETIFKKRVVFTIVSRITSR